jgi:hypothetical protein
MNYHLSKLDSGAEVSLSILDNCVGQNKSNVVMKFAAMMSLLFYKKVVLLFLIPGHSHMIADRVVAWMKNAIQGVQIHHPGQLVQHCNNIHSVNSVFLDHKDNKRPFFTGWDGILDKYFDNLPAGFTSSYLFEFENGQVMYRHLVSTPDEEAVVKDLCRNSDSVKSAVSKELFGSCHRKEWTLDKIRLPRHPLVALKLQKLKSLMNKYFSIPPQHLSYYPDIPDDLSAGSDKEDDVPAQTRARKKARAEMGVPAKLAVGARKPGRPKKVVEGCAKGQASILRFLTPRSAPSTEANED